MNSPNKEFVELFLDAVFPALTIIIVISFFNIMLYSYMMEM
jgi:hypothetical protein